MKKLIGFVVVLGTGAVVLWGYQYYTGSNDIDDSNFSGDAFAASLQSGYKSSALAPLRAWVPQLPVHPRSAIPTEGIYHPEKVINPNSTPARNVDYLSSYQLYATTGPTGGTIMPGGSDIGVLL
jgi:hypothetical protein